MYVKLTDSSCTLTREPGDKRIKDETTVAFKMKILLNQQGYRSATREGFCERNAVLHRQGRSCQNWKPVYQSVPYHFVRFRPSRGGLTGCDIGLIDRKANIILWHDNYAVRNAAFEFNNCGGVSFAREIVK